MMLRFRSTIRVLAALMALASSNACSAAGDGPRGGSGAAPTPGGASGAGASGHLGGAGAQGGAGVTGGEGGSAPRAESLLSACQAYLEAACKRRLECGADSRSSSLGCFATAEFCPDWSFSEGSTRTLESTLSCAEAWATLPCDDVLRYMSPSCATPGTRAGGEPCAFGAQCASMRCTGSPITCGTCLEAAATSGDCDPDAACPSGQECASGQCVDSLPDPSVDNEPKGPGELCSAAVCPEGYACIREGDTVSTRCLVPPAVGEPCAPSIHVASPACGPGAYCAGGSLCTLLPGPGEPCGVGMHASQLYCHLDAYCTAGLCQRRADVGEACTLDADQYVQGTCLEGLRCDCLVSPCEGATCYEPRFEGETCGGHRRCVLGMECIDGICAATDEQIRFHAVCGE
jgi:hypothetical protein